MTVLPMQSANAPGVLMGCFFIWNYEGVIIKSIIKLKYNFAYSIANELADIMDKYVSQEFTPLPKKPVIVPVPLRRLRKNWRGFNQVEEIGKIFAKKLGWGFNSEILIRNKKSTPQVELKGDERRKNVQGIFALNPKYKYSKLRSANYQLLLFDDVLTTGATIREAGKILKRNGARSVWGLTIAS